MASGQRGNDRSHFFDNRGERLGQKPTFRSLAKRYEEGELAIEVEFGLRSRSSHFDFGKWVAIFHSACVEVDVAVPADVPDCLELHVPGDERGEFERSAPVLVLSGKPVQDRQGAVAGSGRLYG
jgi:hypothetical protein